MAGQGPAISESMVCSPQHTSVRSKAEPRVQINKLRKFSAAAFIGVVQRVERQVVGRFHALEAELMGSTLAGIERRSHGGFGGRWRRLSDRQHVRLHSATLSVVNVGLFRG